jgi:hypothetical protein
MTISFLLFTWLLQIRSSQPMRQARARARRLSSFKMEILAGLALPGYAINAIVNARLWPIVLK